jgi:general secretion pathway protein G
MKKAFTLIELIIVIVIIGILMAVAVPKLFATRDDAIITRVRTQIANIRSAIADYHTKEMMKGLNKYPNTLDEANVNQDDQKLFEGNHTNNVYLLEYPVYSKNADGHWMKTDDTNYTVKIMNNDVKFDYNNTNGHFDCDGLNSGEADTICAKLTH